MPDWVAAPIWKYYLYFADHKGSYIRLAYADDLKGPWVMHPPWSLQLADSLFPRRAAGCLSGSRGGDQGTAVGVEWTRDDATRHLDGVGHAPHRIPDVHVDTVDETIVMPFHGLDGLGRQVTRVATSPNGIHFTAQPDIFSRSYLRAFTNHSHTYALVMPGQVYRFTDGQYPLEEGPLLFNKDIRHSALLKKGDSLHVFWSQVGDVPERILMSTIDRSVDWREWRETESIDVLCLERPWKGAGAPLEPSVRSVAYGNAN